MFFILSFLILMVFSRFSTQPYKQGYNPPKSEVSEMPESKTTKSGLEVGIGAADNFEHNLLNETIAAEEEELLEFENQTVKVTFSNKGGGVVGYKLLKYKTKSGDLVNLVHSYEQVIQDSVEKPVNTLTLRGPFGDDSDLLYIIKEKTDNTIKFEALYKGWRLEKEYEFAPEEYMLGLKWKIRAPSSEWGGDASEISFIWSPNLGDGMDKESSMASRAGFRGIWLPEWNDGTDNYMITNKKAKERSMGPARWLGLKSRYFMFSWIPEEKYVTARTLENVFLNKEDPTPEVLLEIKVNRLSGSSRIYLGPLEYPLLSTDAYKALGLASGVDLGWRVFRPFSVGMLRLLNIFFDYTKNYGTSIILLTLLVKIVLWYPSHKSQLSMKKMQVKMKTVQPKLDALKKRFKDNSKKLSEETMKLYREQGINPASGCLPMLIQLPIMFALYSTLANAIELRGAPALWLDDLSTADPTHVLPIIMGAGMLAQTLLAGTMTVGAPAQQRMMMIFMPIMFTAISFSLPSGLILYWAFLNIISIVQTQIVNKRVKALGLG